jgi:hypothetical protein
MNEFTAKENTHIVIKHDDVLTMLTSDEAVALGYILDKIENTRYEQGKKIQQSYYVVNRDEPYAQEVFDVIKRGELAKEIK